MPRENVCNFFAVLRNSEIRKIDLIQKVTGTVRRIFIDHGEAMFDDSLEQITFDGGYTAQQGEVMYVPFELPENITSAVKDPLGVQVLDLAKDSIKTLFWYEDERYYFQNFDSRKLLQNKNVFFLDKDTYNKLEENAFIVEEAVHAVHANEQLFFYSYVNANKVFSLLDFFQEATNEDLEKFASGENVMVDQDWLSKNANTVIRKQIALLKKSGILDTIDPKAVVKGAQGYNIDIELDGKKIKFPNDAKKCRGLLNYLNEQYYAGVITGNKYVTNSKRAID